VPIGKLGDDRFAVRLVGKALNTSDELSERAVRGDSFKKAVTGEPMSARDVYKPAVTFRPVALHLFSTNALPSFKGGVDGGVARRLLALEFAHAVPEGEVIPDLDERIAREEADLLLELAVEGAQRILRSGLFTVPKSSTELMAEWLVEVDPVRGWAGERLEVIESESRIAASVLHADFVRWAERRGFGRDHLPSPNAFGRRLMAATPDLKKTHSDGIVYTNVRWKPEKAP
jgi:phage/plasmid-associated DNA primase